MLNIGIDATAWHNQRGYGRHIRALISALVRLDRENHYTLFFDSAAGLEQVPDQAEIHLVKVKTPTAVAASSTGRRSLKNMWLVSRALSSAEYDLLFFPTVYSFVPVWSRARKLVMIHDLIPEKFPHYTLPSPFARMFWAAKSALGRWQADALLTVSDFSRQQLAAHFNLDPENVYVVGEASDPVFKQLDSPAVTQNLVDLGISAARRLVTFVGGFGPHKNLSTLVEVFARISAMPTFSDVVLVLVGQYQDEVFYSTSGPLQSQIKALMLHDRVIFTGYLPDDELVNLLNLSTTLVLPSYLEGFGLPAIEAAACGCPVVATKASPLPQILGEGGLYVDPFSSIELEQALVQVLESPELRQHMSSAGISAAKALSWDKAARDLMQVFQSVASPASKRVVKLNNIL